MTGPGDKTFKQLWRELCKDGWKPRKPTRMAKHHRYVKPGITGREAELMAFGRASGRLQHPLPSVRVGPAHRPIGKQASYEAVGEEPPHGHPPLTTSAPPPSVTATESAQTPEVSAPQVSARVQPLATAPLTPEVNPAGLQPSTEVQAQLAITDGTEQDEALQVHDLDNTEHGNTEFTVPGDTEQERRNEGSDTEWNPREKSTEADEAKSESDDPADYRVDFDVFDSDNFMEGL
ncbi:uncharacterized protein PITG_19173 [Phytophthora infestans T30-4]|uniref:Uncharacterized protein n=1 Tax=Phytophthora infestans (strain T30-4) TaxID=403677 RepID=D0NZI2_PHYIT|nr:uncharacterized protein PITG_19173 [Phytophthora infestans T30-4]EEY69539.1 conserved hypothetical protein [Phytophthora infestans T30-4]|eukprot:XP_002997216.1 conserved hypothetical protein [Phytophthora infestans T30-4]